MRSGVPLWLALAAGLDDASAEPERERRVRVDPPAAPGAMGPNLRVAGNDVLATWIEPAAPDARAMRVRFARLRGRTWTEASTVAESAAIVANWADFPSAEQAADGTLFAHFAERPGSEAEAYDVMLARSTDGGRSWTRLGRAHDDGTATEHGFVSLLRDGAGVQAIWLDGRATHGHGAAHGDMQLRGARLAAGLEASEIIDARVCDCCGTDAAMSADGPVLVYRDREDGELRDISVVRRTASGWSPPRPVHADGWRVPGCPVNGPAVAARGRRVATAWYTYAEQRPRVLVAFSSNSGRTFGAPIEVDAPRGRSAPLGRVDLALSGDDALVSWIASDREDARVLVRRVARDGRRGEPLAVTTTRAGRDAGFPRMARLAGTLVFAWTEPAQPSAIRAELVPLARVAPAKRIDSAPPAVVEPPPLGAPAPGLSARALSGEARTLASLRGQVVLVNVWATWCEPCRQELPILAAMHTRFAGDGLRIVGVSVDRDRTAAQLEGFAARRKIPFEIWHDPGDSASAALGVATLPATFLVDRSGCLVWRRTGAIEADDTTLEPAIRRALAQRAAEQR